MEDNKPKALTAALSQIEKQFANNTIMRLGDESAKITHHHPQSYLAATADSNPSTSMPSSAIPSNTQPLPDDSPEDAAH